MSCYFVGLDGQSTVSVFAMNNMDRNNAIDHIIFGIFNTFEIFLELIIKIT